MSLVCHWLADVNGGMVLLLAIALAVERAKDALWWPLFAEG